MLMYKPLVAEAQPHELLPIDLMQSFKALMLLATIGALFFYFFTETPNLPLHYHIRAFFCTTDWAQRCKGSEEPPCTGSPAGAGNNTGAQGRAEGSGTGRTADANSRKGIGQKRPPGDGSDDEDDSNHPHKRMNRKEPIDKPQRRPNPNVFRLPVHCPFFLFDHDKYIKCSDCMFTELPRLLEHLLIRTHCQPVHCQVCGLEFREESKEATEAKKEEHMRLQRCQKPAVPFHFPGINKDEETKINALRAGRGRKAATQIQAIDKWLKIWEILFPRASLSKSPYVTDHPKVFYMKNRKAEAIQDPQFQKAVATLLGSLGVSHSLHKSISEGLLEEFCQFAGNKQGWDGEKVRGHAAAPKKEKGPPAKQMASEKNAFAESQASQHSDVEQENAVNLYPISSQPIWSGMPPPSSSPFPDSNSYTRTSDTATGANTRAPSNPQPRPSAPLQTSPFSQLQVMQSLSRSHYLAGEMANVYQGDSDWRAIFDTPPPPERYLQPLDNNYFAPSSTPVPTINTTLGENYNNIPPPAVNTYGQPALHPTGLNIPGATVDTSHPPPTNSVFPVVASEDEPFINWNSWEDTPQPPHDSY